MSKVVIGCRVAVPHSHWSIVPTLLFIYISQFFGDSFSVSQEPPIGKFPSHSSLSYSDSGKTLVSWCYSQWRVWVWVSRSGARLELEPMGEVAVLWVFTPSR